MPLSQALVDQFNRDGVLIVENVFKPEEIETLRQRTEDIANGVVTTYPEADIEYEPGGDRERRLADIRKLNHCDANDVVYRDAARNPGILDVIESLLGPDINLESEQLFMKPPGGIEKAYHQDGPYFSLDPISFVSSWIAMDM
jgi:ectoine hydroxylase-related dioxygenase (phytanoyl-CoA dioxygenase family)